MEILGADREENGCISSAGHTWSEVKDSCIRIIESGTPFVRNDKAKGITDSSKVAYIILAADRQ